MTWTPTAPRRALLLLALTAVIAQLALVGPATAQEPGSGMGGQVPSDAPQAVAPLINGDGEPTGVVRYVELGEAVLVEGYVEGLQPGFHGFHIHAEGQCVDGNGEPDFSLAGGHFGHQPGQRVHGDHFGDMPPLLATAEGDARILFVTDRYTLDDIVGRAQMVHSAADNFANIPGDRYESTTGSNVPDEDTLATGDAGDRAACGVIEEGTAELPPLPARTSRLAARLIDTEAQPIGGVDYAELTDGRVLVTALVTGLEPGFHGFHVHSGSRCLDDDRQPDFSVAGGHLGHQPGEVGHGDHPGDLPSLYVNADGSALLAFVTDRVDLEALESRTQMVHSDRDNFANIPADRYASTTGGNVPDEETLATGDAGDRVACGPIAEAGTAEPLFGPTRIGTAVQASQTAFPGEAQAEAAVLTRADAFPDGLTGSALAVDAGGPLLLTGSDELSALVAEELTRAVQPGATVYLLGGRQALSRDVADAVAELGFEPERLAGDTRFETAVAVAEEIGEPDAVLLTTGQRFPDALAAGAAAGHAGGVVLLSADDEPHPATDDYLGELGDVDQFAVGGPAADAYPDAEPLVGATRVDTAVLVAETFFDDPAIAGIARQGGDGGSGDDTFADALAGGAFTGGLGGPLLLTATDALSPATGNYLCEVDASLGTAYVFGGPGALSPQVFADAILAASGEGC